MKTVVIQHTQKGKRELLEKHLSRQNFRVLPCETADEASLDLLRKKYSRRLPGGFSFDKSEVFSFPVNLLSFS